MPPKPAPHHPFPPAPQRPDAPLRPGDRTRPAPIDAGPRQASVTRDGIDPGRRLSMAWIGAAPAALWSHAAWASPDPARLPFPLLLAREAPADVDPRGFLVSEKLDGVRALWDGQRLRLRSGVGVLAPPQWLQSLPPVPLDGELWAGRGRFESLVGTVRRARPDPQAWAGVRLVAFDLPMHAGPFENRAAALRQLAQRHGVPDQALAPDALRPGTGLTAPGAWAALAQRALPDRPSLSRWLADVVHAGGEGLMLHRALALHRGGRQGELLKLKPQHDAEAQVLAHVSGQGRHQGRLGALWVRSPEGVEFRLGSGFSDAERESPPPVGAWVTYRHRGHTEAGVPRFATFVRLRSMP